MIKKKIKNAKGISLISLVVTTVVIVLLANIIIYNIKDNLKVEYLRKMQSDIANLDDKVASYYAQNGKIPASIKYTNIDHIKSAGVISDAVDTGDFFVIELSALQNLTLNYGEDFEKLKESPESVDEYKDLYIINETSHNIFYVQGITIDNETFYTNYTSENVDLKAVDLRYVEGVKIPDGFYYVGGTKDTGIVISDVQGDNMNNDSEGNQFVWVPVENFSEFVRKDFGKQNIADTNFINTELADGKYYEPKADGIMNQTEAEQMYKSVKNNKGFYIARYEAGTTETSGTGIRGNVVSKKKATVYNNIKWGNSINDEAGGAVQIARGMDEQNGYSSVTSTLCYGVQWDAVLRWIGKDENLNNYLTDSTGKGNYSTSVTILTGSNENYQMKNIYDMAGNVCEWTMENYGTGSQVSRGGSYNSGTSDSMIAYRYGLSPNNASDSIGFRMTLYLNEEEKWSPTYDKEGIYKDENGNTAYIPQGFQVSEKPGENTINEGLVSRNAETDDRYVWIEVPKSIYTTAISNTDYTNIEKDMQVYVSAYRKGRTDTWYDGCILATEGEYNNLKNTMLKSVYDKGGFWIGQYEMGIETPITDVLDVWPTPVSKEGIYPYVYITCGQAQQLASNLKSDNYTCSLMFGIQWDLVLKHIETKKARTQSELNIDSTSWGNYQDSTFDITKGQYSEDYGKTYNVVTSSYTKASSTDVILTTGATNRNSALNIYDLAGNLYEWTLENGADTDCPCGLRGGYYGDNSVHEPAFSHGSLSTKAYGECIGFRPALY